MSHSVDLNSARGTSCSAASVTTRLFGGSSTSTADDLPIALQFRLIPSLPFRQQLQAEKYVRLGQTAQASGFDSDSHRHHERHPRSAGQLRGSPL
ncbi:MAG: hypothetical protein ACK5Q5_06625 [Planctomycetaceae bacterium]